MDRLFSIAHLMGVNAFALEIVIHMGF